MKLAITLVVAFLVGMFGVSLGMREIDARNVQTKIDRVTVQSYNDGFADGVCAGNATVARIVYHFHCR